MAPDGRIATAALDLLFEPLPAGPLESPVAIAAFTHRLTQFGERLRESLAVLSGVDPESARILEALDTEIRDWTASLQAPTDKEPNLA